MTIEFKENRYFAVIYFVGSSRADWMAAIWRDEGGPWNIQYRFRYCAGFDGEPEEKRSWFHFVNNDPDEATVVAKFEVMAEIIARHPSSPTQGSLRKVLIHSSDMSFMLKLLEKEPFWHMRAMTPEESKEIERERVLEMN